MSMNQKKKNWARFSQDKSGMAAATFAIAAVPLMALMGLTFDASLAYRYKGDLQAAADATTLSLARRSVLNPEMEASDLIKDGKLMFERKVAVQGVPRPITYQEFSVDTGRVDSVIKASSKYKLKFGALVGVPHIEVKVTSRAEFERNRLDFYMLVDNSPSMALGAGQAAINRMEKEFNCAFACHTVKSESYILQLLDADTNKDGHVTQNERDRAIRPWDWNRNGRLDDNEKYSLLQSKGVPWNHHNDTYDAAKAKNIPLRIDAVGRGIDALTRRIEEVAQGNDQHRVGLYHFGDNSWNMNPTRVLKPTSNMGKVRRSIPDMDLMIFGGYNYANTEFKSNINHVKADIEKALKIPANDKRRPILFFVTDGVNDGQDSNGCRGRASGRRCHEPVRPEQCEALKDQGIRVAVLYTPYLPVRSNGWYNRYVWPWQDQIAPKLEACATPGLFFEADLKTDSIEDAMVTLLDRAIRALRLTPTS